MSVSLEQIQRQTAPGYDLSTIEISECGRMPIFYLEVSAKWKKKLSDKADQPAVTLKMVYKGLPKIQVNKTWLDKFKRDFLKIYFGKGNDVSDVTINTFSIVKFKPVKFLGYENMPGLE